MKVNGAIDIPSAFKVGLGKVYYLELDKKEINFAEKVAKGEKRKSTLTGEKIYFMKADVFEKRAGFGTPKYISATFEITKQEFDEKPYAKGDVIQIQSGSVFDISNFIIKDKSPKTLELVEKKYHKQMIDPKTKKPVAYVENRIANLSIRCKQGQFKLHSKKTNAYYYLIENIKFQITESELTERTFTFYLNDETVYQALLPLHLKTTRVELHSLVKRLKVHEAEIQCGIYEGQPFINLIIVTKTKEEKEQEKLTKLQAKESNVKQKILKIKC